MAGLRYYLFTRAFQSVALVIFVITISFTLVHMAPGDPVDILVGEYGSSTEYKAALRERFGLDKPIYVQLLIYFDRVFHGDFGYSFVYSEPVFNVVASRVPATVLLMGAGMIFSLVLGIPLGIFASRKPNSVTDNVVTVVAVLGYGLPVFWFGMLLMLLFSLQLGFLPAQGMHSSRESLTGIAYALDVLPHLVLPTISHGTANLALYSRLTRASMLEELRKDYITMARSKGLSERTVLWRHAFRNSVLPLVTVIGLSLGSIIAGAVLTETVFAWPGIGRLMYDSISTRDYPVLMGIFIISSTMVILANFLADSLYAFLDPRIRSRGP